MFLDDLLNKLKKVKRQTDGSYLALCPAHTDKNPSLHLSQSQDRILIKCLAGCRTEDIVAALNLTMADLFSEVKTDILPLPAKKITATYDYTDEEGTLLYQVVRYEPKNFSQRRKDEKGNWIFNLNGVRRVLYHLPEVLRADKIYLVEGEKDADNLIKAGVCATTSPGGASNWRNEYAEYLAGKQVVIIPDNDQPGLAYAKAVSASLKGKADVKCIILKDTFKDISDWLKVGRTIEELGQQDVSALEYTYVFENKGSRYIFKWGVIQCEVSRIRSTRGATGCQLVFTNSGQHMLRTKFNLESSRVRSELAKDLSGRLKDVDWKQLLEDLANRTLEEFEKGEPIINVTSNDEVEALQYLINPIAPLGKPTFIFGDPGAGKSQMSVIITILTSLPWHDNPLRLGVPDKPTKGLILDWEGDADDARRQLRSFTEGMELGWNELYYRRCSLPLADDVDSIRTHIEDIRADYIIIDSASMAAGGDLNHMDVATNYLRALRQLNLTSISLAHTNKNRESKDKTILGSVLFEAGARSVWEIRGQEDDDCFDIALFHRKSNLTKKSQPLGYRISYLPNGNTIEWHDSKSVPEFVERMNNSQRILISLKDGAKTHDELVKLLGIPSSSLYVTTQRLKKSKNIIKVLDKWSLVSHFEANLTI